MTPTDLEALRERVRTATGPDRDLGVAINEALEIASYITDEGDPTESLDAALELVERKLPGACPGVSQNVHYRSWYAWLNAPGTVGRPGQCSEGDSRHSASLAIIDAILSALIAQSTDA